VAPLKTERRAKTGHLPARAGILSLGSGSLPSSQVKAAAAEVGDHNCRGLDLVSDYAGIRRPQMLMRSWETD